MRRASTVIGGSLLALAGCVSGPSEPGAQADPHYEMYLVYRIWSDDLKARAEGVTAAEELAHQQHIEAYSRTALSSNLHGANGEPIGVVALNAFERREDVEYYVYEDPYTKAGFYREITIVPVELTFLDEYFRIEPDWIRGAGLAAKHRRYAADGIAPRPAGAPRLPR